MVTATLLVGAASICAVPPARAQDDRMQHDRMEHDEAMHGRMKHDPMEMRGMLGSYAMSREASGTSWQPDSTPMTGFHRSFGGWMAMFHGFVNAVYTDQQGPRGDEDAFVSSMFMAMAKCRAGDGTLGARAMLSLDPLLIGDRGYALLFQTGETADGVTPLIDRQHPHDLFMELAASYSVPINEQSSVFVYGGLPGEPALGPPTFMHRFSGIDNPEAPLLHHWLDSTHITFGVATVGYVNRGFKLEASAFNGREPDENRYDIETRGLDSWSARVSYNLGNAWAAQASYGELDAPEQLEPETDVDRASLSLIHSRPLAGGHWQSTLAWGSNDAQPGDVTDGYLLETAAAWGGKHTLFGRVETVEKHELFLEGEPLAHQVFRVGKLSIGYIRDVDLGQNLRLGFVAMASRHFIGETLATVYGDDPTSYLLLARLRL